MNFTHHKMGFPHYIQALEAERRKIQVFSKELPLSLDLVTQAIEACRVQLSGTTSSEYYNWNGQSERCSGHTSSDGPVLEEFIPIKKRASSDCCHVDDEEDDEQHSQHKPKIAKSDDNKAKSDWLRSVQLWNNPQSPLTLTENVAKKASVVEVKTNGGAFQPFHKDTTTVAKSPSSTPSPVAAASSTAEGVAGDKKEGQSQRKQRRCWSQDLHKRFLHALHQLGGPDCATPKQIRELMKVDGLTNDEVKSHLQKFRLHTRRPSPMIENNVNSQTAPFVIVGNFIMQPPEYASKASAEMAAPPTGIYTPAKVELRQMKQHCEHSNSEERGNRSEVADHSNSPTSSFSTHT